MHRSMKNSNPGLFCATLAAALIGQMQPPATQPDACATQSRQHCTTGPEKQAGHPGFHPDLQPILIAIDHVLALAQSRFERAREQWSRGSSGANAEAGFAWKNLQTSPSDVDSSETWIARSLETGGCGSQPTSTP